MNAAAPCPCFSGSTFAACCDPYLSGAKPAPTAEALMRSRYAAFATGNMDYLEATLLPDTRGDFSRADAAAWARSSEWTGLEILRTESGRDGDAAGIVEFTAHYRQNGKNLLHHETSRFVRQDGRWYYVEEVKERPAQGAAKAGRNDPCPCGSGRKYKKCCGATATG